MIFTSNDTSCPVTVEVNAYDEVQTTPFNWRTLYNYELTWRGSSVFKGNTLSIPSGFGDERALNDCVCFLTTDTGDEDNNFTDLQKAWFESLDCELLSAEFIEREEDDDSPHNEGTK